MPGIDKIGFGRDIELSDHGRAVCHAGGILSFSNSIRRYGDESGSPSKYG